jgi:hypothetical protein
MPHEKNDIAQFKGFDDFVEIVKVGDHVAMSGEKISFTTEDLDQMAANTPANSAPIVVGHPKTDAPAYGWGEQFKRKGNSLFAKFGQVNPQFADWVAQGAYKKRSVSVVKGDAGWKIKHVGWLGAAAPAIEGMADMQFAADDGALALEFGVTDAVYEAGYLFNTVGNFMRVQRDLLIAAQGIDVADKYFPEYQLASLQNASERLRARLNEGGVDAAASHALFAAHLNDEIAAQIAKTQVPAEFAARERDLIAQRDALQAQLQRGQIEQQIQTWQAAGKLTPAHSLGVADFMAQLSPQATFEFASASGTASASPQAWFSGFVDRLSPVQLGAEQGAGTHETTAPNAVDLVNAAHEFTKEQADKGVNVTWKDAVLHVTKHMSTQDK